jgi:colicin import membrane protein
MRTGLTVSTALHAGLIALAIVGLGFGQQVEATPEESIAVDLVPISEFSNIRKGDLQSTVVDTEAPSVVDAEKPAEVAQPTGNTTEDQPTPEDTPDPTPAPTEQTAPPPEASEPDPAPEPVEEAAPVPEERPAAAEPPPEPEPKPVAEPEPVADEPPPLATPTEAPDPADAAPKPVVKTASLADKRAEFKKQQQQEKQKAADDAKAAADAKKAVEAKKAADAKKAAEKKKADEQKRIEQAKADEAKLADELANIINNDDTRGATTGDGGEKSLGKEDGRSATLSQSQIGALVAQLQGCISLPAGAEEADAKAEFSFSIGPDGMLAGAPQQLSAPSSAIEGAYSRAVQRALMQCGPFTTAAGQDVKAQFAARSY